MAKKTPAYYDYEEGQIQNGGTAPNIDYDSEEFYEAVRVLAMQGAKDGEIGVGLRASLGHSIDPYHFSKMINGNEDTWTDEENDRRGARLRQILTFAREDINRIVRSVYLQTALGRNVNKSTTTVKRRLKIDGQLTDNEEIQTTEVITGIQPNMAALGVWLYHHDKEWQRVQKGMDVDDADAPPQKSKVKKGVDITSWLDKELQEREMNAESEEDGSKMTTKV